MPSVRKYRRETSEISCCLKYLLFSSNVVVWTAGLCVLAVGIWAWNEKDMFSNLAKLTFIALDPAFVLICTGTITFIIGFTGSVGALRENTCLLSLYAVFLSLLLMFEISLGILTFVLKDKGWIKDQATDGLRAFIIHYREDPDQQNLIDWIQEDWLQCCGIDGPKDWDSNNYFNCSSSAIGSREACGVPFSCCRRRPTELIKNKQCGYDVRKEGYSFEISKIIYEKGCVQAGEEWIERNLIIISTSVIVLIFVQILGICFTQNLRADITAQKSKWH
ncbi:PREDICTED: tetraspanin-5 isoform X1 [Rhagoletis zephyria]|uniref:tetraspanin-5 isoform X1 n=1 Tax=Rhagoletis zephyria TaxID=28612 RepID=UPI0008118A2D|nr:PREDICTED: tetraspanin-5 isoform X1 [Rhagoletis zephyria]XP_036320850.1 tetraspanin-5 isoform X1 [Rhagoletis pomonella]XP_036320851.1 tetraspanin-5 isoform X1 [Rhagoletis pomonella]